MAWRKPTVRDLAATLNQREIDLYRAHPDFKSDADPIDDLLKSAAEYVRGFIRDGARRNRRISMSPRQYEIPESLILKTMDYVAFDVIKRLAPAVSNDRKNAREKAEEFFAKIAQGDYTPESYSEAAEDAESIAGMAEPRFDLPNRKILSRIL